MAVGQTEPLGAKEGRKRILGHAILWAAVPQAVAAGMRELGLPEPGWQWWAMGAQLAVTAGRELWEVKKQLQTKGKAAVDFGAKAAATIGSWAAFGLWW